MLSQLINISSRNKKKTANLYINKNKLMKALQIMKYEIKESLSINEIENLC
jgi:hypothetical protein